MAVGELMSGRESVVRRLRRTLRDARESIYHQKKKTSTVDELASGRRNREIWLRRVARDARGSIHH